MTDMQASIDRLTTAVEGYRQRAEQHIDALEQALRAEREAFDAYAQREAAEDVEQDEELRRAREQTDQAMAQIRTGGNQLENLAAQLETATPGTPGDQPSQQDQQPQDWEG